MIFWCASIFGWLVTLMLSALLLSGIVRPIAPLAVVISLALIVALLLWPSVCNAKLRFARLRWLVLAACLVACASVALNGAFRHPLSHPLQFASEEYSVELGPRETMTCEVYRRWTMRPTMMDINRMYTILGFAVVLNSKSAVIHYCPTSFTVDEPDVVVGMPVGDSIRVAAVLPR